MAFSDLHPSLLRALAAKNYTEPTPVQQSVLRPDAADRDLLVSAQTGSGKTIAYGFTLASMLLGDAEKFERAQQPLALIVAPTRELAQQVQRELEWLFADAGGKVISCVGGMDIRREQRLLSQGAHIVVGTPGRLTDHLKQRHLYLAAIRAVVLDEADEMLDMGFREELEILLNATPPERRTLLFSATLPKSIMALANRYQKDALRLALSSESEPHRDIEYKVFPIRSRDTEHAVVNSLRFFDAQGALVFCSTRETVRHLHASLQERGFSAVALSGEMKQSDRNHALQSLRDGRARVCVATDVAARGLDMPDLGLVIHADLPQNREALLHRSGRTGRAGRKGISLLIVQAPQRRAAERLLTLAKVKAVWSPVPSAESIRAKDEENLIKDIAAMAEAPAEEDLVVGRQLLALSSAEQIAAVLVRLRREKLPAPEVLEDPGTQRKEAWPAKKGFAKKQRWGSRDAQWDAQSTNAPAARAAGAPSARSSYGSRSDRPARTERPARPEGGERFPAREFAPRTARPERTDRPERVAYPSKNVDRSKYRPVKTFESEGAPPRPARPVKSVWEKPKFVKPVKAEKPVKTDWAAELDRPINGEKLAEAGGRPAWTKQRAGEFDGMRPPRPRDRKGKKKKR